MRLLNYRVENLLAHEPSLNKGNAKRTGSLNPLRSTNEALRTASPCLPACPIAQLGIHPFLPYRMEIAGTALTVIGINPRECERCALTALESSAV